MVVVMQIVPIETILFFNFLSKKKTIRFTDPMLELQSLGQTIYQMKIKGIIACLFDWWLMMICSERKSTISRTNGV
jgi:hypothetical protein